MNNDEPLDPHLELAAIRARIVGVERELDELRMCVAGLETRCSVAPKAVAFAAIATPAPVPAPATAVVPLLTEPPMLTAPAAPQRPQHRTPPHESDWSRLRSALQQFQLWPPHGESNAEVRLGAWWSTRVGALLAVIGVVFFGIYVSIHTPPWVKLSELLMVTLGVGALGLWLERRVPKFGVVISGVSLALLYFAAYAAYAVPPLRVLESPWQAVTAQCAAVSIIFTMSMWRRSEVVATMAVALGFVAGWFSFTWGLGAFVLGMGAVLAVAATGLRLARGWRAPVAVAMPLAYATVARLFLFNGIGKTESDLNTAWISLGAFSAIFFFSDWLAMWRQRSAVTGGARFFQTANSSCAILLGLATTLHLHRESLTVFYLGTAVLSALAALAWHKLDKVETLVPIFLCKAASLIALAVIEAWSGHVRALVLIAQAIVLLVVVRESGLKSLRIVSAVIWAFALLLFARHSVSQNGALGWGDFVTAVMVIFGAALWTGWNERWINAQRIWKILSGLLIGAVLVLSTQIWSGPVWGPARAVALAAAALLAGAVTRGWTGPIFAASVGLLAAHVAMAGYGHGHWPEWQLWTNEAVLLSIAVIVALVLERRARSIEPALLGELGVARLFLATAAVVALQATWFNGLAASLALAAAVATAGLLMGIAGKARGWPLAGLSTLALALGGFHYVSLGRNLNPSGLWLGVTAVIAWVPAVWFAASTTRRESVANSGWRTWTPVLQTVLATLLTMVALSESLSGASRVGATALTALVIAGFAWRPGLVPALTAATVLIALGAGWASGFSRNADAGVITATIILAAVTAVLPMLARRFAGEIAQPWKKWAVWVHPFFGWFTLATFFIRQRGDLAPYATMLCGLTAIVLFLFGLFARERTARLAGLAGLVLCVPRAFFVDIDSTLDRIGAFVVLGVVLLWVGFSYHRFRHLITGDTPKSPMISGNK